jgi:hypothetical protein
MVVFLGSVVWVPAKRRMLDAVHTWKSHAFFFCGSLKDPHLDRLAIQPGLENAYHQWRQEPLKEWGRRGYLGREKRSGRERKKNSGTKAWWCENGGEELRV